MDSAAKSQTRVLVVDDNAGSVAATVKYLELRGYAARGAANGRMALAEAAAWLPDVVILDLGLPDIDGFTVLQRLQETSPARPVTFIAVSGRADDATKERGRRAGFDHFLVKPVRLEFLTTLLPEAPG